MEINLRLTPDQVLVLYSRARTKVLLCGRRWGKTSCLAGIIIDGAFRKKSISHYISPTYARSMAFHRLLKEIARPLIKSHGIQPVPWILWANDSYTSCRSGDRMDNLRGDASDLICLDEACMFAEDDVNAVIRPMLSDRRGTLILASTPRGFDWVHKLYEQGQKKNRFVESWRFPTSAGPAFQSALGKLELVAIQEQIPKIVYEQEYLALPAANIARVFGREDVDACTIQQDAPPLGPSPGRKYQLGIDVGRIHDNGAFVIMDDQGLVCHAERVSLNVAYEVQAQRANFLRMKWGAGVIIDTTGGGAGGHLNYLGPDAVIAVYRTRIENLREMQWNTGSKEKMVMGLSVDFEQRKVKIPSCFKDLLSEVAAYEYTYKNGLYRYSAPTGFRDDEVAALLMVNLCRRNNWLGAGTGKSLALAW